MYGDLRYVSPGEYAAFVNQKSDALRERYYDIYMQNLETQNPEAFNALPENYREEWNAKFPLGWVEHRQAWDPAWDPKAKYATWVLEQKVAIQLNDLIFLHGGISAYYCQNSLESITVKARDNLSHYDPKNPGIVEDPNGPFWYRGLSGVEPDALPQTVDAILAQHDAQHIVVGHTPTGGVIWPRYDDKIVMIDSGISSAYGGHIAYLEITADGLFAGYPQGKLALPVNDGERVPYLEQLIQWIPDSPPLLEKLKLLNQPLAAAPDEGGVTAGAGINAGADGLPTPEVAEESEVTPPLICGISQ
jgi:hypothetical protein